MTINKLIISTQPVVIQCLGWVFFLSCSERVLFLFLQTLTQTVFFILSLNYSS